MAERWQTSEARVAAVFFRDASGNPVTGLSPTATSDYKDGTAGAPGVTVVEVGNGFYRCTFATAPTKDVLVRVDGGGSLTTSRYVALEVPVGGYVDSVDATVSSRASQASVTAVQADTDSLQASLAVVENDIDTVLTRVDVATSTRASQASVTALGSPAQSTDYTTARAAKLDNLDATVSSRSSQTSVTALGSPAQAADWTAARAVKVDNLDATVSSRATGAAVAALSGAITALGSPAQATDAATLLARLTAARAALLDELDPALADRIARESDVNITLPDTFGTHAEVIG